MYLFICGLFVLLGIFIYIFAFSPISTKYLDKGDSRPITSTPINPTPRIITKPLNPFTVSKVDLASNISSLSTIACGTNLSVTYTATFYALQNSNGGTQQFSYTTTNGRGSTPASLTFSPGETMKTYTFTATGIVTADNTFPGIAEVLLTSPSEIHSPQIAISGTCH